MQGLKKIPSVYFLVSYGWKHSTKTKSVNNVRERQGIQRPEAPDKGNGPTGPSMMVKGGQGPEVSWILRLDESTEQEGRGPPEGSLQKRSE